MPQPALRIVLTDDERETLTAWSRSTAGEHRMVERSRIILLAAEGLPAREIARRLKTRLDECPSGDGGSGRIGFPAWKMRQGRETENLRREDRETSSHFAGRGPAGGLPPVERPLGGRETGGCQRRSGLAGSTQT